MVNQRQIHVGNGDWQPTAGYPATGKLRRAPMLAEVAPRAKPPAR